ncbi:hypothetical protein CAEBREN_09908 [Caenorhabditis brenneri]|uniref:Domain of unknown function WSN domain-containing protein n=1 Tax=Caenorhabditis brenneri TaxID=135651 RepID=G0MVP5_CAEBE|nr:hypothetical protein CAEBREN_09908 [Caenorhabditis brenneri]
MKIIAYLTVLFLIVWNRDFGQNISIVAASNHRLKKESAKRILFLDTHNQSLNWFNEKLTHLAVDINKLALYSLLKDNSIDGYGISKEVLGLPADFDLEIIHKFDFIMITKELEDHAKKLQALPRIEGDSLKKEMEELENLRNSKVTYHIASLRKLLDRTIVDSLFGTKPSKLESLLEKNAELTQKIIDCLNRTDCNIKSESSGWETKLTEKNQEIKTFIQQSQFGLKTFMNKFTVSFEIIQNFGDGKTFDKIRAMTPIWQSAAIKATELIEKLGKIKEPSEEYKKTMRLLAYIKHPEPLSSMMVMVAFMNKPFEEISSDDGKLQSFLSLLNELSEFRDLLKNDMIDALPNPDEFLENKATFIHDLSHIHMGLADWNFDKAPRNFKNRLDKLEKDFKKTEEEMKKVLNRSKDFLTTLKVLNSNSIITKEQFSDFLREEQFKQVKFLGENKKLLDECHSIMKNISFPEKDFKDCLKFLDKTESNMNYLNQFNFDTVEKLVNFSSRIQINDSVQTKAQFGNFLSRLSNVSVLTQKIQRICIEMKNEEQTIQLDSPLKLVWQLDNGLKVIQQIHEILETQKENQDSDEYKMVTQFLNSIDSINKTDESSLIEPFLEAQKFRTILIKKRGKIDWIRFFDDIDGVVFALSKIFHMNDEEVTVLNKSDEGNMSTSVNITNPPLIESNKIFGTPYPYIIPVVLLLIVICLFSSKVLYKFIKKVCKYQDE